MPRPCTRLHEEIANRLSRDIQKTDNAYLPGIHELARQYQVSYMTMWRALQLLKKRKVIAVSRGRQSVPVSRCGPRRHPPSPPCGPTVRMLADRISAGIVKGTWKHGTFLPKTGYFVLTYHTSYASVVKALQLCADKGLVHRQGKRWIAGAPEQRKKGGTGNQVSIYGMNPVIVCVLPRIAGWYGATVTSFAKHFYHTLKSETEQYGISMIPAVYREEKTSFPIATGLEEIVNQIHSLGKRYYGTLLSLTARMAGAENIEQWVLRLLEFDKPVLWIDTISELHLREPVCRDIRRRAGRRGELFFHCAQDGEAAVRLAIETLAGLGHHTIGVAVPFRREWLEERLAQIRNETARLGMSMHVCYDASSFRKTGIQAPVEWKNPAEVLQNLERLTGMRSPRKSLNLAPRYNARRAKSVLSQSAALRELLLEKKVSALVACNDYFAQDLYGWLLMSTLPVPKHLSLLSFDNRVETQISPITTIDYGMVNLAYRAAHVFIGDIPVKADTPRGGLLGEVSLVDRGSIGPARRSHAEVTAAGRSL